MFTGRSTDIVMMEWLPCPQNRLQMLSSACCSLTSTQSAQSLLTTGLSSVHTSSSPKALMPKDAKNLNHVYFADSYASWQKESIENANKLIRQCIPKGTDYSTMTDAFNNWLMFNQSNFWDALHI